MRARRTCQLRVERMSGPSARFAKRSSNPGCSRGSSGYALDSAAPGSERSNIQARQKQLPRVAIPLIADRLPAQIEADVGPPAHMHAALVRRHFDVDLKEPLHDFAPFPIARVERKLAAALAAERGAGQLIARCRHDAAHCGVIDPLAPLNQAHLDI